MTFLDVYGNHNKPDCSFDSCVNQQRKRGFRPYSSPVKVSPVSVPTC